MNGPFSMCPEPLGIFCGDCADGYDNGTGVHCTLTGDTKDYYDQCVVGIDDIGVF